MVRRTWYTMEFLSIARIKQKPKRLRFCDRSFGRGSSMVADRRQSMLVIFGRCAKLSHLVSFMADLLTNLVYMMVSGLAISIRSYSRLLT